MLHRPPGSARTGRRQSPQRQSVEESASPGPRALASGTAPAAGRRNAAAADGPHRAATYRSLSPGSGSLAGRFPLTRSRATIPPVDTAPPKGPPAEEWASITHRFSVGGHIGYISVAADEHDRPVLIEVRMSKAGGLLRGLLDSLAASVTLGLQRGVPLSDYVALLSLARFEPAGWTERMGYAHSVVDYLFRWLGSKFPGTGAVDPPTAVADGETCGVCGTPVTWGPGSPCPDCGDIGL